MTGFPRPKSDAQITRHVLDVLAWMCGDHALADRAYQKMLLWEIPDGYRTDPTAIVPDCYAALVQAEGWRNPMEANYLDTLRALSCGTSERRVQLMKQCRAAVAAGIPKVKVAEAAGVHRATLDRWLDDESDET
jgi:hypothetical protein